LRYGNALILLLALLLAMPAGADDEVSRQRLEALKERINEVSAWLDEAQEDEDRLLDRLRTAEREIGRLNSQLRDLEQRTQRLNRELRELAEEESQLTTRLERQRESLTQQLRTAWMHGDTAAIQLLLSQADPQSVTRTMTYYEYISRDAVKRLEAFQSTLAELALNRETAEETRDSLSRTRSETASRRDDLAEGKVERQSALEALQARISERQDELSELQSNRDRLEELLKEAEAAVADIEQPEDTAPFDSLKASLPWPVEGELSARYGQKVDGSNLRHNGIRIRASRGEDVNAVHYGRVVFANWLRGFGLLIILDHGDGYMSLYGNNSSLLYGVGDWVRGGDTIALTGDSGGQSRAGLYFEIRHQGNPQNPMQWLR